MTEKKTDNEESDVAPYLSAKADASQYTEGSSLFIPFVLTVIVAVAIYVIFYGAAFKHHMAMIGIDIEGSSGTSDDIASTQQQYAADSSTASAMAGSRKASVLAQSAAPSAAPSADSTNRPPASGPATSRAPHMTGRRAESAAPATPGNPYTRPPVPAYAYPYPPPRAYQYAPFPERPESASAPESREDMLKRHQKIEKEYEAARETYEKRMEIVLQARKAARQVYAERLKEIAQQRDEARQAYEESMRSAMEDSRETP